LKTKLNGRTPFEKPLNPPLISNTEQLNLYVINFDIEVGYRRYVDVTDIEVGYRRYVDVTDIEVGYRRYVDVTDIKVGYKQYVDVINILSITSCH
jgi:hypothetical protein